MSEARKVFGSTRRVMIPLLERLDAAGVTEPLDDGTRRVRG
ncbi:SelB domain-containing protein [Amycolatopsis iheyensis]